MPFDRSLRHALGPTSGHELTLTPFRLEVGAFRSVLTAHVTVTPEREGKGVWVEPRAFRCSVDVGTRSLAIGKMDPWPDPFSTAWLTGSRPTLAFPIDWSLTPDEFWALSHATAGRGVRLQLLGTLDVSGGEAHQALGPHPVGLMTWEQQFASSDWQALLEEAENCVLIDGATVVVPRGSRFAPAARYLREARGHWLHGDAVPALTSTRLALDEIEKLDPTPAGQWKNPLKCNPEEKDPADLRARRLMASVRTLANLGPHDSDAGAPVSLELVHLALASAAGFLRFALERRADADPTFWVTPSTPERPTTKP